uniref:Very-long-chain (3R)-3-hydroxyacyl-CoA dehydratase n=1 Tax=Oryza nivara TaxID=4536 RepID=A0A0E0GYC1_ORYNI
MALLVAQILHGLVGLVRSPVSATLPQIGSRLFLTWGILWSFPETHSHILVTSLVISWSITEIIRYSFFGMKEAFGFAPSWLLWLRYSTFMVLYPTGISSEVGLIYIALPYMKASEKYCLRMPNKWNFSFDFFYASILSLAVYVPAGIKIGSDKNTALQDRLTCSPTCLPNGRRHWQRLRLHNGDAQELS